jgi:hypothetical protein
VRTRIHHPIRELLLAAGLSGLFSSCGDQGDGRAPAATLWLTDTLGVERTAFRRGEDFLAHLVVDHDPADTLLSGFAAPQLDIGLWRNDSLVAAATWDCVFLMAEGAVRDTLQLHWRAPTGLCQEGPVTLAPGSYEARAVVNVIFEHAAMPAVPLVPFFVTP